MLEQAPDSLSSDVARLLLGVVREHENTHKPRKIVAVVPPRLRSVTHRSGCDDCPKGFVRRGAMLRLAYRND